MDKIGRDFSTAGKGIANLAVNAFNEVTTAVKDAIEFATNPYGGVTDKDFSGMMSGRDDQSSGTQQISDMAQYDNTVGIASLDSIEKSKADEIKDAFDRSIKENVEIPSNISFSDLMNATTLGTPEYEATKGGDFSSITSGSTYFN
jgi:hypothetical protein